MSELFEVKGNKIIVYFHDLYIDLVAMGFKYIETIRDYSDYSYKFVFMFDSKVVEILEKEFKGSGYVYA
ncbi:hypothetical protein V7134_27495 [Priestia megaterium]|uniref:hypothetical protein n=1 Tax=Priestia megaterium TaxID=1404 RepID=UPI002FFF72F0